MSKKIDLFSWSSSFNEEYTTFTLIADYILDREAIKTHYGEDKKRWVAVFHDPDYPIMSKEEEERIGVDSFIREFSNALERYKKHLIITFVSYFDLMLISIFESYFTYKPKLLIDSLNNDNISIKEIIKVIVEFQNHEELLSEIANKASQKLNTGSIDQRIQKLEKTLDYKFDKIAISNLSYLYKLRNYLVHENTSIEITDELLSIIYDTLDFLVLQIYLALSKNLYDFSSEDKEYFDDTIKEAKPPSDVKIIQKNDTTIN